MFDFKHNHHGAQRAQHHHGRPRRDGTRGDFRGDSRGAIGRQLRDELRRNLRHAAGNHPIDFDQLFGRGRPGPGVRRGEIRPLIFSALAQKPMHGYEVIQWLEDQSGGRWRPSAGSVYPTLQQLADEGLVTSEEVDGRRTYTLTEAGHAAADESAPRAWGRSERGRGSDGERQPDVRQLAMQLAAATIQVHKMGSPHAKAEAVKVLTAARKQMYRLLSEDEPEAGDDLGSNPDTGANSDTGASSESGSSAPAGQGPAA
jgi:DNA-binding PadR family transcriptional regulator